LRRSPSESASSELSAQPSRSEQLAVMPTRRGAQAESTARRHRAISVMTSALEMAAARRHARRRATTACTRRGGTLPPTKLSQRPLARTARKSQTRRRRQASGGDTQVHVSSTRHCTSRRCDAHRTRRPPSRWETGRAVSATPATRQSRLTSNRARARCPDSTTKATC